MPPVQEHDTQKSRMQKLALEQQPSVQPLFLVKHTESIHTRQSTRYNLEKIFPKYAQEHDSDTNVPGKIMCMNMIISRITEIYVNAVLSDLDTMCFQQATKENYATQFLKVEYKEFEDLRNKVIFELIPHRITPEEDTLSHAVWEMKLKQQVKTRLIYNCKA